MDNSIRDFPSTRLEQNEYNNQNLTLNKSKRSSIIAKSILIDSQDDNKGAEPKKFSAQEIESAVKTKIINNYKKAGIIGHKLKSKKENGITVNLTESKLNKIIKKASQQLANVPVGTTVQVEIKDIFGKKRVYDATLAEKNSRLSLKIHTLNNGVINSGSEGIINDAIAIHSGQKSINKSAHPDNSPQNVSKKNRIQDEAQKLRTIHAEINKLTRNDITVLQLLLAISPYAKKLFIPIIKAPVTTHETMVNNSPVITGAYLEKGTEGDLFSNLIYLDFSERVQIAKDILAAIIILEKAGFSHLDLKPENIVIFRHEGKLRAKLIDFGFSEKHIDSTDSVLKLDKASAFYIDKKGLDKSKDSRRNWKNYSPQEINNLMIRRDRVAFSRIMILLLYPRADLKIPSEDELAKMHYFDWDIKFDDSHKTIEKIYNDLNSENTSIDLKKILDIFDRYQSELNVF